MPTNYGNMMRSSGGATAGSPSAYSPALGGKPANVVMPPNRYEQIQSIYGNLPSLTKTAGDTIGARMQGLFTPETRRGIANEAAMRGYSSGMPGAQIWENRYMGNIIGAKENLMEKGLAEFNTWTNNLAQMMDDPALKAQIDQWNNTINAAPEPQAAFDHMLNAMKDLMRTTGAVPNTPTLGGLASTAMGGGGAPATPRTQRGELPTIAGGPLGYTYTNPAASTYKFGNIGQQSNVVPDILPSSQLWNNSVGYALGDYNYPTGNPYALDTGSNAFTGSTVPQGGAYTTPTGYYNFGLPTNQSDYSAFNIAAPTQTSNFGLPGFNDFTPVSGGYGGGGGGNDMGYSELFYGVPESEMGYWGLE